LIALIGILVYANVLQGAFVWDDEVLVVKNTYIRDFAHFGNIFTENILGGVRRMSAFYRPLQVLTYALDFSVWKLDPFGYHLGSVLWHVGAAFGVFFFLTALTVSRRAALWTALFFVVHPVHTEAVSYISGRADSLAALFIFLSLTFYVRCARHSRPGLIMALSLFAAAALLSKEVALLLPFMALLYHHTLKVKIRPAAFAALLFVAAGYLILRRFFSAHLAGEMEATLTLAQRIPGSFAAYAQYLRLLVWPAGLHMEYGQSRFSFADPVVWAGVALLAASVVFLVKARRRDPLLAFASGWFLLTLAPVANIFPVNAYMAEHWLYLPSVGFFLAGAIFLDRWAERGGAGRRGAFMCVVLLVASWGVVTIRQNTIWKKPVLLYGSVLEYAPESQRLLNNLANIYAKDPLRQDEAIALYRRAIVSEPEIAFSYFNLANLYKRRGQEELAVQNYTKAIELNPSYVEAYSNLGVLYFKQGRFEDAAVILEEGAGLNLVFADIHHNLANTYQRLGRPHDAMAAYERAVALNPGFAPSHLNLALAYFRMKDYYRAAEHAKRARALGADVPEDLSRALASIR